MRASFNIASVLQIGTGQYRISFASPLSDANYVVGQGLITNTGGGTLMSMTNGGYYATGGFDFWTIHNDNLSLDNPAVVSVVVFGN